MRLDLTITLGTVLTIATLIATAYATFQAFKTWASIRIAVFEKTLSTHAEALEKHAERLDRHEEVHRKLMVDVQAVVTQVGMLLRYWAPGASNAPHATGDRR